MNPPFGIRKKRCIFGFSFCCFEGKLKHQTLVIKAWLMKILILPMYLYCFVRLLL